MPGTRRWLSTLACTASFIAVAVACISFSQEQAAARFEREIAWTGEGTWLRADLHVHTKFSDGSHTVDEVIAKAAEFGCDVAAITDHTDGNLRAATPEYHAAIAAARERYPQVTVLTGFEWNIPPGKGIDHVTLLVPPALEDQTAWLAFKERFDDFNKSGENPELGDEALGWLADRAPDPAASPVLFLNHPSRRAAHSSDVLPWVRRWHGLNRAFVGFEGAPGHQRAKEIGAYRSRVKTLDRWDPVVADVGGVWDQLLAEGVHVWGSSATSDFHSWRNGDYWPCQFSETWVYARDRGAPAVLEALRAGSFFGVHGRVVSEARLEVSAEGLRRPAVPGEIIVLPEKRILTAHLTSTVPELDWNGEPNRLDRVELIAITSEGAHVLATSDANEPGSATGSLQVPAGGLVLRGRGCRAVDDGPDLCFYTNPIRVRASGKGR